MRRSEARRLLGGVYKGHVERHVRVVAQREVEGAAQGRDPPLRHAARKEEKLPVHGQPVKRCGSQFAAARRAGGSRRSLQGRERSLTRFAGGSHVPTRKHGCDTAKGVTRLWPRPRKGRGWGESPRVLDRGPTRLWIKGCGKLALRHLAVKAEEGVHHEPVDVSLVQADVPPRKGVAVHKAREGLGVEVGCENHLCAVPRCRLQQQLVAAVALRVPVPDECRRASESMGWIGGV